LITDPLEIERIAKNIDISLEQLAAMIDHTKLKPYEVRDSIRKLCEEAKKYGFAAVYVHPIWVPFAKQQLKDTRESGHSYWFSIRINIAENKRI